MSTGSAEGLFLATPNTHPLIDNKGRLNDKSVVKWQTSLCIALVIIEIIGLAAVGTGLASFGTHRNYWAAGALSNLGQLDAIVMMSIGSVLALMVGIVSLNRALVKKEPKKLLKNRIERDDLVQVLQPGEWTYARQLNGNYSLVVKPLPAKEVKLNQIKIINQNIFWFQLESHGLNFTEYTFRKTSPIEATDILISPEKLQQQMESNRSLFTFVRQVNGHYSAVSIESEQLVVWKANIPVDQLASEKNAREEEVFRFVETSPIEGNSPLIDLEILDIALEPGTFTAVLHVDGQYRFYVKEQNSSQLVDQQITYSHDDISEAIENNKRAFGRFVETSPFGYEYALQLYEEKLDNLKQINQKYANGLEANRETIQREKDLVNKFKPNIEELRAGYMSEKRNGQEETDSTS